MPKSYPPYPRVIFLHDGPTQTEENGWDPKSLLLATQDIARFRMNYPGPTASASLRAAG